MCGLGLKQKLTEMGSFLPNQQAYAINSLAQALLEILLELAGIDPIGDGLCVCCLQGILL